MVMIKFLETMMENTRTNKITICWKKVKNCKESERKSRGGQIYNHVHNILRPFDGWANFPFTTSETKRDY